MVHLAAVLPRERQHSPDIFRVGSSREAWSQTDDGCMVLEGQRGVPVWGDLPAPLQFA